MTRAVRCPTCGAASWLCECPPRVLPDRPSQARPPVHRTPNPFPEIAPPSRPNPSIVYGWSCPVCGESHERWGTVRRRVGWRPWKRLVHVDCDPS